VAQAFGQVVEKLRRITVQVRGSGSGVIWSSDGKIVTNAHVVEGAASVVEVGLWDGRRSHGRIVHRNRWRDLAILQIEASGLPDAIAGDSDALRVGELVIAVGNPLGFIGAASTGVVHGIANGAWVVSQLRLAPGNSGGPLANARGEVIGINTMVAGAFAFSVPSRSVARFLNGLTSADAQLGVVVRPIPAGLIVLEVIPRSAADRASLLQGDILVGANSTPFRSAQDLEIAIARSRGAILELQFRRDASPNIRSVAVPMAPVTRAA
jgi:serine protease Do